MGGFEESFGCLMKLVQFIRACLNEVIFSFALNRHADKALETFKLMQKGGFELDGVLFNGAPTGYNIANKGLELLGSTKRVYRIISRIEQYGCLVNFYSGAGRLEEVSRTCM
ncbi:hypothetical protein POM88_008494 [Heracleum sosnowskyi]|uniref:Pentatricopeptide repeat-containing protein n=1 Tax=Heracleum sosnowskyi TaxID=360622 RepID=A0AAD8J7H6_9APIA|nr:hypothetical protein POM88_008494 [Heracleum sosnowskyi]